MCIRDRGLEPVEVNQAYAARDVQELGKLQMCIRDSYWRVHEGSTSGGTDAKPYGAKAAKKARADHRERTGRAGTIEDGLYPSTYRVRWDIVGDVYKRQTLMWGIPLDLNMFAVCGSCAVVSMWVGVHMFRKTQDRFVLHI